MRKLILPALMILPLMLLNAGCASTGGSRTLDAIKDSSALQTLFIVGAMKAIEQAEQPVHKAARIRNVAEQIQIVARGESIRGAALELLIQEAIGDRVLQPSDRYLLSQVQPLTAQFVGEDGYIVGERLARLREFLAEVIGITQLYGEAT